MDALFSIGEVIIAFVAVVLMITAPFWLIETLMDRRAHRLIRERFAQYDIPIAKLETHRNHYGVRFERDGTKYYVRCRPSRKSFYWIRPVPDFIVAPEDICRSR